MTSEIVRLDDKLKDLSGGTDLEDDSDTKLHTDEYLRQAAAGETNEDELVMRYSEWVEQREEEGQPAPTGILPPEPGAPQTPTPEGIPLTPRTEHLNPIQSPPSEQGQQHREDQLMHHRSPKPGTANSR